MQFDIGKAKQDGYSDSEIAEYLSSQSNFDISKARKDGYSDLEISDHLSKKLVETPQKPVSAVGKEEGLTWGQAFTEGFMNIPDSAWETVKDMVTPLLHPIETGKSIGRLTLGLMERSPWKLAPGLGKDTEHEKQVDQVVDFFRNRYGSTEGLKKSIAEDPVGVSADIASILTSVGMPLKAAGTTGKIGRAGEIISKAGAKLEPVGVVRQTVRGIAKAVIPKELPSKLYQSGAKFRTSLGRDKRARLTQTALEGEILPSVKGIDKLTDRINDLNTEITHKIDLATSRGGEIPVEKLFTHFDDLHAEFALSGKPITNQKIIDGIKRQISMANQKLERNVLKPGDVQSLKQKIYKDLESYYSAVKESPASVKAQKAVAKAAKEALEELIPEIKYLNKTEGSLIELKKAIEQSSSRIRNRDLMGIGTPIKAVTGGVAGGAPGVVTGLAIGILDTPAIKSRLALVANRLKTKGIKISKTKATIRLGLFQVGRTNDPEKMTQPEYEAWRRGE